MPPVYKQYLHWYRFNKNSDHLFPKDSKYWERILIEQYCTNIRFFKLRVGWQSMEYMEVWISCIGYQRMGVRYHIFIPSVKTRVKPLKWFRVLVVSYLVYFLINHGHPLLRKLSKSDKDFLLSLNITSNKVGTTKIRISQYMWYNSTEHCIYYGPTFGYDIYIDSDANENRSSFTDLGFAYEISPR